MPAHCVDAFAPVSLPFGRRDRPAFFSIRAGPPRHGARGKGRSLELSAGPLTRNCHYISITRRRTIAAAPPPRRSIPSSCPRGERMIRGIRHVTRKNKPFKRRLINHEDGEKVSTYYRGERI